jgi:hypothetical protein
MPHARLPSGVQHLVSARPQRRDRTILAEIFGVPDDQIARAAERGETESHNRHLANRSELQTPPTKPGRPFLADPRIRTNRRRSGSATRRRARDYLTEHGHWPDEAPKR